MSGCCVYGCSNRYSTKGLKFYRIPTGSRLFRDWSKDIIKNARVCSAHFISGEASLDSSSPDFVPSVLCTQNRARIPKQSWRGKGGEMTDL